MARINLDLTTLALLGAGYYVLLTPDGQARLRDLVSGLRGAPPSQPPPSLPPSAPPPSQPPAAPPPSAPPQPPPLTITSPWGIALTYRVGVGVELGGRLFPEPTCSEADGYSYDNRINMRPWFSTLVSGTPQPEPEAVRDAQGHWLKGEALAQVIAYRKQYC